MDAADWDFDGGLDFALASCSKTKRDKCHLDMLSCSAQFFERRQGRRGGAPEGCRWMVADQTWDGQFGNGSADS